MTTLCLCMIVRNEAHIIERALASVRDLVDYWVVCDTGSTDATPLLVLRAMAGVPGELYGREWRDFGHNRTEVLRLAREKADYSLVLDADMVAVVHGEFKSRLTADLYEIRYEGDLDYSQPMLVSNRHDWRYVGVTHEYLWSDTASSAEFLPELMLRHFGDGGMRTEKFTRDVRLLRAEHEKEPDNPRTVFYLAQSYRDLSEYEQALRWYQTRARMTGWDEETFIAALEAGRARLALDHPSQEVEHAMLDAYSCRPTRLEPLYTLTRACRERGDYARGYLFSRVAADHFCYPQDRLFVERSVYTYRLALEHAACALAIGRVADAVRAFNRVLDAPDVSANARNDAIRGLDLALPWLYAPTRPPANQHNRITVLVPFHNPGRFLERCVESLRAQDHPNFRMEFVDDASDDGSAATIPVDEPRFHLLCNKERREAAHNIHHVVTTMCAPEEIIVHVDGDDWLARPDALSLIDLQFRTHDCWVSYGQYETSDGAYGVCRPFPDPVSFGRVREGWVTSHVKAYRAGLFHRIAEQDPDYACLKDEHGRWLDCAADAALMFPLLEMAGFHRVRYQHTVLYTYNVDNPLSVHATRRDEERERFLGLQRRQRFLPVDSAHPVPTGNLLRRTG